MEELVYFNGEVKPISEVWIDIDDRGYNFADGVYEVIAIYNGTPFKMEEHFVRLLNSAQALEINFTNYHQLMADALEFMKLVNLSDFSKIYIQLTRGSEKRGHVYSDDLTPNVFMTIRSGNRYPDDFFENGCMAITITDERWPKCYIKSISLLPNILGKKKAKRAGVFEAIQIRDGYVTEGTSSNVFIVKNGEILTPYASNYILNGITRQIIVEEAKKLGLHMAERSISLTDMYSADEVFLTGTSTEVMPIIRIDDQIIGDGAVGTYTKRLFDHYRGLLPE